MKVREAQNKDYDACSRRYRQLYIKEKKLNSKKIPFDYCDFKNILLIAEDDEKIIGFIWGNFIAFGLGRYGYMEDLYVNKKHRNTGVAKSLITASKEEFKKLNVATVFVTTEKGNKPAINLFLKEEFERCPGPWFYWIP